MFDNAKNGSQLGLITKTCYKSNLPSSASPHTNGMCVSGNVYNGWNINITNCLPKTRTMTD